MPINKGSEKLIGGIGQSQMGIVRRQCDIHCALPDTSMKFGTHLEVGILITIGLIEPPWHICMCACAVDIHFRQRKYTCILAQYNYNVTYLPPTVLCTYVTWEILRFTIQVNLVHLGNPRWPPKWPPKITKICYINCQCSMLYTFCACDQLFEMQKPITIN